MFTARWFWSASVAAILYGAHQIFTRLALEHNGDGIGGFVVETLAACTLLLYFGFWGSVVVGAKSLRP